MIALPSKHYSGHCKTTVEQDDPDHLEKGPGKGNVDGGLQVRGWIETRVEWSVVYDTHSQVIHIKYNIQ